jgi:hypothetical protein
VDHWVSTWQRNDGDDGMMTIYLLGSAHWSPRSIRLAKQLIQATLPQLVFIEFNHFGQSSSLIRFFQHQLFQRFQQQQQQQQQQHDDDYQPMSRRDDLLELTLWYPQEPYSSLLQRIFGKDNLVPNRFLSTTRRLQPKAMISTSSNSSSSSGRSSINSRTSGKSTIVATEFLHAAWQGHVQGASAIVLGDRNQWVTFGRYLWHHVSCGFAYTFHWFHRTPQENDEELSVLLEQDEKHDDDDDDNDGTTTSSPLTRDLMKRTMESLQQAAPVYYQVFVEERNIYMASNINTVMEKLMRQQQQVQAQGHTLNETTDMTASTSCVSMVAVVGKGHIHGVEQYLQQQGWQQVSRRSNSQEYS